MADFKPSFKSTENIGQVDKDGGMYIRTCMISRTA